MLKSVVRDRGCYYDSEYTRANTNIKECTGLVTIEEYNDIEYNHRRLIGRVMCLYLVHPKDTT